VACAKEYRVWRAGPGVLINILRKEMSAAYQKGRFGEEPRPKVGAFLHKERPFCVEIHKRFVVVSVKCFLSQDLVALPVA
jgi:hypothetical protein